MQDESAAAFLRGAIPALALALILGACSAEPEPVADQVAARPAAAIQDGYVGSAACAGCHAEESAAWQGSRHQGVFRPGGAPAWQQSPPPPYSDDDLEVSTGAGADGPSMRVIRGGAKGEFPVDAVIGGRRMQSYATKLEDGAWLLLPMSYQVEEQALSPYTQGTCGVERIGVSGSIGWQSFERVWNHRCIDCHVTAGSIGFDLASLTYDSTWVDNGAGCESCHGPGEEHVKAAEEGRAGGVLAQPDLEVCASCHAQSLPFNSRWGGMRPYRPGDDFQQAFLPLLRPAESGPFATLTYADHTPATGVMEYQGLAQSLCALRGGATCVTCHDPHSGATQGDGACAGCHADLAAAAAEHSRHDAGRPGGACVDCHMAPTVAALGTRLASHAIDVPLPVNNVEFGVPDSCSLCHADRGADWADARYREMWGDPSSRRRRRLAVAFNRPETDALRRILADAGESPLIRADAAVALGRIAGSGAARDLVQALDDAVTPLLVKRYAVDLLGGLGLVPEASFEERAASLQRLQELGVHDALRRAYDSDVPALRLGAASALARLGTQDGLNRLEALRQEPALAGGYRLYQALGKYHMLAGHLPEAAEAFEQVLRYTPNYLDVIKELGFVYFSSRRFTEARDLWMRGLILAPGDEDLRNRIHLAEDEMRKAGQQGGPAGS